MTRIWIESKNKVKKIRTYQGAASKDARAYPLNGKEQPAEHRDHCNRNPNVRYTMTNSKNIDCNQDACIPSSGSNNSKKNITKHWHFSSSNMLLRAKMKRIKQHKLSEAPNTCWHHQKRWICWTNTVIWIHFRKSPGTATFGLFHHILKTMGIPWH